MRAPYPTVAVTAIGKAADCARYQNPPNTPAIRKLINGPAAAMRTSKPASCGSSVISDTPPKKKRVILAIGKPFFFAMYEWESSWTSTETNRTIADAIPIIQYVTGLRPGYWWGMYP
jgi:hypothetical protein